MRHRLILTLLLLATCCSLPVSSAPLRFSFSGRSVRGYTAVQAGDVYNDDRGWGYDFTASTPVTGQPSAFFFSVRVPDGNYRVRITLGSKSRAGSTTVRCESRRLLFERVATRCGETRTVECVVNKRDTVIRAGHYVKIKPAERVYPDWDNRLTLEFCGPQPQVAAVEIERDTVCPTVFLCGNSTVVDQPYDPYTSWGQMFTRAAGPLVAVANYAESGLTADSFLYQRRLEKILAVARPGDYIFMEFGHNDQKQRRPGSGAYYSFAYAIKQYIDQARAAGCTPVICTPTRRRFWADGAITNTHGDYPDALRQIAEREQVPLIDLQTDTKTLYEAFGPEGSKCLLVHYPAGTYPDQDKPLADNTHHNAFGAYEIAKCVATAIAHNKVLAPLAALLRDDFTHFDPASPDRPEAMHFEPSQFVKVAKPDGN